MTRNFLSSSLELHTAFQLRSFIYKVITFYRGVYSVSHAWVRYPTPDESLFQIKDSQVLYLKNRQLLSTYFSVSDSHSNNMKVPHLKS